MNFMNEYASFKLNAVFGRVRSNLTSSISRSIWKKKTFTNLITQYIDELSVPTVPLIIPNFRCTNHKKKKKIGERNIYI